MSLVIIFILGYFAGGISALLLLGLAIAGRERARAEQPSEEHGARSHKEIRL